MKLIPKAAAVAVALALGTPVLAQQQQPMQGGQPQMQQGQQQMGAQQAQRKGIVSATGRVVGSAQIASTAGDLHDVVRLRKADGSEVVVDLGVGMPAVEQGSALYVTGYSTRINGKPVIFARYAAELQDAGYGLSAGGGAAAGAAGATAAAAGDAWAEEDWASDEYGYYDEDFYWSADAGFDEWYGDTEASWGGYYDDTYGDAEIYEDTVGLYEEDEGAAVGAGGVGLFEDDEWANDEYGYYNEDYGWTSDNAGFNEFYGEADQGWGTYYDDVGDEGLFDV